MKVTIFQSSGTANVRSINACSNTTKDMKQSNPRRVREARRYVLTTTIVQVAISAAKMAGQCHKSSQRKRKVPILSSFRSSSKLNLERPQTTHNASAGRFVASVFATGAPWTCGILEDEFMRESSCSRSHLTSRSLRLQVLAQSCTCYKTCYHVCLHVHVHVPSVHVLASM